ncbi:GNAT family N-acetyltransferase [Enterovibrio norvegicus FF-33]|uniref:GNAT family N-acetyltransferase n=1 Tax=Enterovibrio norvegicus TaxID=188144 RepID=UPI0003022F82|nr:GNAT family N-acetyltransferase [Enterovibrio norvegicus]OEE66068.1 GNAT family N-acetyltransferase [Enterovibrio norvegicus FF-33]
MVSLEKLKPDHENEIRKITLGDEQAKYTALPDAFLSSDRGSAEHFVVMLDGVVVGYFKIERDFSTQRNACDENAIGLRKFAIDLNQQGKGLGKAAVLLLGKMAKEYFPEADWLYLTVNCKNTVAYQCYLKGGFEDTHERYLGGPNGPQHIMRLEI